jgi:hypothetical protein
MSTTDDAARGQLIPEGLPVFTRKNRAGFVLALLLGVLDLPSVLMPTPDGEVGPPIAVLVLSTLCGVATLAAVIYGWVRRSWPAIRAAAGSRIVSMLLAMPALFVEGLPGPLRALAALFVLVTIVTVVLMLLPARRAAASGGLA